MDIMEGVEVIYPIEVCETYGLNISDLRFQPLQRWTINGSASLCLEHAPKLTYRKWIEVIVLSILAVLSLVGNVATIVSIRRSQKARRFSRTSCSAIYSLILQLSVADLLVTVFCLAGEAAWSYTVEWLAGNAACKLFKFVQMFSLYLSTFVLVLIGVDRFVAVRYPMKSLSTARRGTNLLIFVWILSALLSVPQIFVFHKLKGPFVEEFYQCVTHGSYTADWQEPLYTTLSLLFMFVIPLLVLLATYAATFKAISKSEKVFREEVGGGRRPDLNRRRLIHRAKMKSLRISVVIVVAFVIWWTPYYTMMIICIFVSPDNDHLGEELRSGIFFFGMSNSLVNPVIYGAFQMWPAKRRGSQREGSIMNHRSTMTQASIMRQGSTRIVVDRLPIRHKNDMHYVGDEEMNLVRSDHSQLSRCNSRDLRRQSTVNDVITSKVASSCKNITANNRNNNLPCNINGAVTRRVKRFLRKRNTGTII